MDSKNDNPDNQNQLDLEFNQMEPITPKKPLEQKRSLFDKMQGFVGSLSKKEVNNTVRQEPIINKAESVAQSAGQKIEPTLSSVVENNSDETAMNNEEKNMSVTENEAENIQSETENETIQAVPLTNKTTEAENKPASSWKKPETWAILQRLPEKHRRLVVALIAAILVLFLFLWLKSDSSQTVDNYQPASNSLPIEFQPLDQSAVVEENNQPATPESVITENSASNEQSAAQTPVSTESQSTATAVATTQPAEQNTTPVQEVVPQSKPVEKPTKVVGEKPVVVEKPKTVENAKPAAKQAATTSKPVEKPKATIVEAKPTQKNNKAPIVEAKTNKTAAPPTTSSGGNSGRTITIEKGKTLFQVFRDNGLDIRDANAMTKVSGAGNALSNFKPGDQIRVSSSNGHVTELRLPNGSRFVRQSDGTYSYK